MIYIVFGVSGIGKTTVGKLLSNSLNIPFYDADDFHLPENIDKMSSGQPLNDEDRLPWLKILSKNIVKWNANGGGVLACSALKESYRKELQSLNKTCVKWVFLNAEYEVVLDRLKKRKGHFLNHQLLKSQFVALEIPNYGIHIDASEDSGHILNEIHKKMMKNSAEFGLIGLGVMGKSLALNIAGKGTKLAVYNRQVPEKEVDIAKNFENSNSNLSIKGYDDLNEYAKGLQRPRSILLMVNAGKPVDMVIDTLIPYLEPGDLIIDGGNSHFKNTKKRLDKLKIHGIDFIGMGVSGGEEGALKGPSIMPSGSKTAYERVSHILEAISAKDKDGKDCCAYIGPEGSGQFIKMIHNGIEYGEMQIIAEVYQLLRFHGNKSPEEIATIFEDWKQSGLSSYLLEISIDILKKKEGEDVLLDKILDQASQKGTGGWSTNAALELGKPLNTISDAVMARYISAMKSARVKGSKQYKSSIKETTNVNIEKLKAAYISVRIINHAIGFDTIQEASLQYNWNLNLSEIARIWTNGCIIRSEFMEELVSLFKSSNEHLLLHPLIVDRLESNALGYKETVANGLLSGCSMPVLSSGLNYMLGFISEQSSANMIQAQRDYFGAHTYKRIDRPFEESFHTNWKD
ncbi:NADP-dependent phosphogluconate dehydrogenase [Urechidicola vernalis]|uniref:6-phosphogluconate dehydrogenase, decarboxylating n=1 Tax=Urechidicola vernalis TaxID=3075600 RepID=A0ABU2Y1E3_9FLAO|nr:NADP-dependent phosphogluconate dehydrogenase [Urechidicola sp. P050]MDT0552007.1 NADP-dependent phosphogluconate dehydrogenase [Urechidicola sp. P050]